MERPVVQDEPIERSINIVIESIENITQLDTTEEADVSFVVTHNDVVLGESIPLTIDPSLKEPSHIYDVDFAVKLTFIVNDCNSVDPVVSTPILIKVMCDTRNCDNLSNSVGSTARKKTSISSKVIGFCSLDLMPILLGEKSLTEKVVVHSAHLWLNGNAISLHNLPALTVTMAYDGKDIFPSEMKINFLNITVESIYNPPVFFAEDAEHQAGTIVYIDNEIPENVIFEDGKWTNYHDAERAKKWQSLSKLQSNARLSKWKISRDYANIKNTLGVKLDLQKKLSQDEPRIEWNLMCRRIMNDVGIEAMQKHIAKRKYWPVQFMMAEKKNNIRQKDEKLVKYQLYQCYVDLSELLFPGKKSTRIMTQLHAHNVSEMADRTGLDKDIFHVNSWNKNVKERESKKQSTPKSTTSNQLNTEITQNFPLISETGEPVFFIIEVELHCPLIPCKLETDFSNIIDKIITPKVAKPYYVYSREMAEEQYAACIRKLVEILTESYRNFHEEKKQKKLSTLNEQDNSNNIEKTEKAKYCFVPEEDELTCFTQYLYKTGVYLTICSTLKEKVTALLDQKFKTDVSTVHSVDSQNVVASVYTYLVEQMHLAINKIIETRLVDDDSLKIVISKKLYFYAEEAYELGYLNDARRHHLTAITADKSDPEAWTKYATFLLKIGDTERAKESCREAILSDRRDKIALLMYGLILAGEQNYREAEIFLRAVTDFHPRFVEGWVILHLFYIHTDYTPGIDLALRIAENCMQDNDREMEISNKDALAWTTICCPRDSVYMITAVLLMKLYLCDFANVALAEEILRAGRVTYVLYYLAVQSYLLHQYEDALSYLTEAENNYKLNYSVSSLTGHCYFQKGNFAEAIRYYEFAIAVLNEPDDSHLVQMRMGLYYEDVGDYEHALKAVLNACQISPSAETWLSAGVAFYELQRFTEAEAALSEANQIDNRNASVWKYLCLLNMSLQRHDEFDQCYRQLAKDNAAFSLEKRSLKSRDGKPPVML